MSSDSQSHTASVSDTLAEIDANHRAFKQTRSLRKQYRLCKENEPLFARIGITLPPMTVDSMRGPIGWWIRRG